MERLFTNECLCILVPSALEHHFRSRPLQFNYLSYELFLEKKSCQTPKKKKKKVIFGVLRMKVVLKFSVRLKKKKKKMQVLRIFFVRNQLQEAIIAVVEPQT